MNSLLPNHPGFVHFPIGLLAAAFLFEVLGLATKRPALHDIGRANLFLGTLAALVAVGTGLWGEKLLQGAPHSLHDLMDRHENLAFVVASGAVVLSMWRVALRKKYTGGTRTLFVVALGALTAVTLLTGHIGGQLVYDHGAGVSVGRRVLAPDALSSPPEAEVHVNAQADAGRQPSTLILVHHDGMGQSETELRHTLAGIYFSMLDQNGLLPGVIAFYADGVKLVVEGSPVLEQLRSLEARGVRIVICRTCLDYFKLSDKVAVGIVGGMSDIVEAQWRATKVITL